MLERAVIVVACAIVGGVIGFVIGRIFYDKEADGCPVWGLVSGLAMAILAVSLSIAGLEFWGLMLALCASPFGWLIQKGRQLSEPAADEACFDNMTAEIIGTGSGTIASFMSALAACYLELGWIWGTALVCAGMILGCVFLYGCAFAFAVIWAGIAKTLSGICLSIFDRLDCIASDISTMIKCPWRKE